MRINRNTSRMLISSGVARRAIKANTAGVTGDLGFNAMANDTHTVFVCVTKGSLVGEKDS